MKKTMALILLAACAGSEGLGSEASDAELGQVEQGLSAKFPAGYTYGFCSGNELRPRPLSGSQPCATAAHVVYVPDRTHFPYRFVGSDPWEGNPAGQGQSWKDESRRVFGATIADPSREGDIRESLAFTGDPIPWTFQETTSSGAFVTIRTGTCSGDYLSEKMSAFVCAAQGTSTTLTETLPGTYKRLNGPWTINFDIADMALRAGAPSSSGNLSYHHFLEHAAHLALPWVVGLGSTPYIAGAQPQDSYWSSPYVENANGTHNFSFWHNAECCAMGNYLTGMSQTTFTQQSGVCQ